MNSTKLATAGSGGAFAVLLAWVLKAKYGIETTPEQAAAIASITTIVFGYVDDILISIKAGILRLFTPKEAQQ